MNVLNLFWLNLWLIVKRMFLLLVIVICVVGLCLNIWVVLNVLVEVIFIILKYLMGLKFRFLLNM